MALPLLMLGGMALQGYLGYEQAKRQARMDNILGEHKQKIQAQNNARARAVGDDKQTVVTTNIDRAMRQYVNADASIDVSRIKSRAASVVNAAAAGTAGMSVDDSIMDIERNAAQAELNATSRLNSMVTDLERSRRGIEAQVASRQTQNIFLPTPQPSAAAAALGTGLNMASATYGKTWDFASFGGGGGASGGRGTNTP
jgi:hypothetical protein